MHRAPCLNPRFLGIGLLAIAVCFLSADPLVYAPAPADNPLKGFVPYLGERTDFPHSLEWDYTAVSDVMTGPDEWVWEPFEAKLRAAASRGHHFIARFYLEWPGRKTGVPQYLIDAGLTMRRWTNTNTQPFPQAIELTPDYEDPRLREALTRFIRALGARYDGDPRLGFVALGLLGSWGEWHTHPNNQWFASKTVQREVMDAYETAFRHTRLVARYPAGPRDPAYADNSLRPIGYHDDSFAWATAHTGDERNSWFFESRLRRAGAQDKWRRQPIGGEVRPEVWDCLFDHPSCAPKGQEFLHCVRTVHPSWLAHEGVFRKRLDDAARQRALRAAQQLGYELSVTDAFRHPSRGGEELLITLSVTNTGVAPFYYDWPVELGACDRQGNLVDTWSTPWTLSGIQPGRPPTPWATRISIEHLPPDNYQLLARAPNRLPNAPPVRFANATQDRHVNGWLSLGEFLRPNVSPSPADREDPAPPPERIVFHVEFIRPTAGSVMSTPAPEPLRTFMGDSTWATAPAEQVSADEVDWPGRFPANSDNLSVQFVIGPGGVAIESPEAEGSSRLERLKREPGFESWRAPLSRARGNETCHIQLAEEIEIRTGIHPNAIVLRGHPPPEIDSPYTVATVSCGAWLEIFATSTPSEPTLDLEVSVEITEFIGYARSAPNNRLLVWVDRSTQWLDWPEPQFRFRQLSGRARLLPGERFVLGSWASDLASPPDDDPSTRGQQDTISFPSPPPLLVVLTPETEFE